MHSEQYAQSTREQSTSVGTYSPVVIIDKLAYVSGQGPIGSEGTLLRGRVGDDVTEEQGVFAARTVGLTMLATIKAAFALVPSSDPVQPVSQALATTSR